MLRSLALSCSAVVVALLFAPAAQAQFCAPGTGFNSCSGSTLTYCIADEQNPTQGSQATLDCKTDWAYGPDDTLTCGTAQCTGNGNSCPFNNDERCVALPNGRCDAWYVQRLLDDTSYFAYTPCQGTSSCVTTDVSGSLDDICLAQVGTDCAIGEIHKGCVDNKATWCAGENNGTNEEWARTSAMALDCAAYGATCVTDNTNNPGLPVCESPQFALCDADDPQFQCADGFVCDDIVTGRCQQACNPDNQIDACTGDTLAFCEPSQGVRINFDCASSGGSCVAGQGVDSHCLLPAGDLCDEDGVRANPQFRCQAGLVCSDIVPGGYGECIDPNAPDAGVGTDAGADAGAGTDAGGTADAGVTTDGGSTGTDAGEGEGEDAGCACTQGNPSEVSLFGLLGVGLILIRRRRAGRAQR